MVTTGATSQAARAHTQDRGWHLPLVMLVGLSNAFFEIFEALLGAQQLVGLHDIAWYLYKIAAALASLAAASTDFGWNIYF
jgi:hypothetical protein